MTRNLENKDIFKSRNKTLSQTLCFRGQVGKKIKSMMQHFTEYH